MTRRHLRAARCTCPHWGRVRVLTHPGCRVHGRSGTWKVTLDGYALWCRLQP